MNNNGREKGAGYSVIAAALLFSLILTSCGSAGTYNEDRGASNALSAGSEASMASADAYGGSYEDSYAEKGSEADVIKDGMMVAKTASLQADVLNITEFENTLTAEVEKIGGYFISSSVDSYGSEYSTDRYANYEIKVPADKLDGFLNMIDGKANITSRSVNAEDVTLEYVDTNVRIEALNKEKEELMRLMDSATEVSDLIEIEQRLSDIDYELQSKEQQKRALKGRVTYSTVYVTAHEERNVEHPIRKAFEVNFRDRMLEGISNAAETFVGIVVSIPVIVIVTAFIILFIWLLSKVLKKIFKRGSIFALRYALVPVDVNNPTATGRVEENRAGEVLTDEKTVDKSDTAE